MIGKTIVGKCFAGCVRYVANREEAAILASEGLRVQSSETLIQDFNLQRRMRPELGKAVGHLVLSWSIEDLPKLTNSSMAERAKEYMEKMGIVNTQYVVIRHSDRKHPHLHVIYNRVDSNGKTISDKNSYAQNIKACKEITEKHGYHLGVGKDQVNRKALRGKEKNRYALYDAIKTALKTACSWKELELELAKHSVHVAYKFRNGTTEIQGISFEKGDLKIKGSAIDRSFSFRRLDIQLKQNERTRFYRAAIEKNGHARFSPSTASLKPDDTIINKVQNPDSEKGLLETLSQAESLPGNTDTALDTTLRRKRKKRRRNSQSHGLSR